MTAILCIALALGLLALGVSERRFERRVLALLGELPPRRPTRHLSPHRKRLDEKRRT